MATQFDVVIIGSGAGGAPIAHELARAGKSVLVLEKGPLLKPQYQYPSRRSPFKRDELISDGPEKIIDIPNVMNRGLGYYSSHVEPDLNDEPHIYKDQFSQDRATIEGYTAQLVGGGTNLYGGVSFRFTPLDFKLKSFNAGRQLASRPAGRCEHEARGLAYPVSEPGFLLCHSKARGLDSSAQNSSNPLAKLFPEPLTPTRYIATQTTSESSPGGSISRPGPALSHATGGDAK